MEETLSAIRDEALPALKELRVAVSEYSMLASELRSEQGNAQQTLQHLNRVGAALEKGEGLAGMLLFDRRPAAELRAALPKINASLDELHATLRNARTLSDGLPQIGEDIGASVANMRSSTADARRFATALPELRRSVAQAADAAPGVLLQTQETLRQIERLTQALQRHWLVRGSMDQAETGARLDADRVGTER